MKSCHVRGHAQVNLPQKQGDLRPFAPTAPARFRSPGEGEFAGQKTVGWVCMKIPNSISYRRGLGGRRAPPRGESCSKRRKAGRDHLASIVQSQARRSPRFHRSSPSAWRFRLFSSLRVFVGPPRLWQRPLGSWGLIEASTQGRGPYGVWRHVPAVSCATTATINTCRRR